MSEQQDTMQDIARQVRIALDGGDLSAFSDLLDPDVRWGAPDARQPSCRNRGPGPHLVPAREGLGSPGQRQRSRRRR